MSGWLSPAPGGVFIEVWAKPRSSKTRIAGLHGEALSVALSAPPVDGEANAELIAFFAKTLGIPKSSVEIPQGQTGRRKRVLARGISVEEVLRLVPLQK